MRGFPPLRHVPAVATGFDSCSSLAEPGKISKTKFAYLQFTRRDTPAAARGEESARSRGVCSERMGGRLSSHGHCGIAWYRSTAAVGDSRHAMDAAQC